MLMGALAPSSGAIFLGGEEVTRVSQSARVRRGLGRTFQVTTLFRNLPVLDNVALGIAERTGVARQHVALGVLATGKSSTEARSLLAALGLADDAAVRVADLPYGKQRLVEIAIALGLKPKVLLLDEPAAGVPSSESERILQTLEKLPVGHRHPHHRARHGPRVPLRAAHHRAGAGRGAGRRYARGDCARQARARRLSRRADPCLASPGVRAGYGETVILEDVDVELPARGSLAVLGRNGVGKTTLLATIMGHTTFHSGQIRFQDAAVQHKPVYERCRLGIGYVPQERMIFPSLTVHENLDVARRPGRWTLDARLRACFRD